VLIKVEIELIVSSYKDNIVTTKSNLKLLNIKKD